MGACDNCGDESSMLYDCSYCTGHYCSDHRLPEAHNCPGQGMATPPDATRRDFNGDDTSGSGGIIPNVLKPGTVGSTPTPDYKSSPDVAPDGSIVQDESPSDPRHPGPAGMGSGWPTTAVLTTVVLAILLGIYVGATGIPDLGLPGPGDGTGPAGPTEDRAAAAGEPTVTLTPSGTPDATATQYALDREQMAMHIHKLVNERRQEAGVRALNYDDQLAAIAEGHSRNMATNGYLGHEQPDGTTREDRYREANYNCERETSEGIVTGGENVAKVYAFTRVDAPSGTTYADSEREVAELVVDVWMHSDGHRKNMLRDTWGREGIGIWVVTSPDKTTVYVTQNFC